MSYKYFFLIIFISQFIFYFPGLFRLFQKAGKNGWLSLIPVYNLVVITRIIKSPWWLIFLLIIPFAGQLVGIFIYFRFITSFKKHNLFQLFIAAFFPFIWINYLGFSEKIVYNPVEEKHYSLFALTFAIFGTGVFFLYLVRLLFVTTGYNTSASMESTLKEGDYIFISKASFGPRIPDYLYFGDPHAPRKRFWTNKPVQVNDLLVFNNPEGDTVLSKIKYISYYTLLKNYGRKKINTEKETFGEIEYRPLDKREVWISRCIALPGDTLVITRGEIYVNGKIFKDPATVKYKYYLETTVSRLNKNIIDQYDLSEINPAKKIGAFYVNMTKAAKSALEKKRFVTRIKKIYTGPKEWDQVIFPYDKAYARNLYNLGPVVIPAKGVPLKLNLHTLPLYSRLITAYEGKKIRVDGNRIFVDGTETDSYTPEMNYYWVMSDNRNDAFDSRFWGFLPEDHIIGKITRLIYSPETKEICSKIK